MTLETLFIAIGCGIVFGPIGALLGEFIWWLGRRLLRSVS